jgi:hypothetical protein
VTLTLFGDEERRKFPAIVRFRVIVVELVRFADVPVTVRVAVPVAAVLLALSVKMLEVIAGLGLNDALTPLGKPEIVKLTLPLKPFSWLTLIVVVVLAP